jgi:glycosyltransferase involved in cell wall biosynthesis
MSDAPRATRALKLAIVAASLRIVGGHAVQAQQMLNGWASDADVDAWLVPVDPLPPPPFDRLRRVKFLRTVVTQVWYWPLLVRELRRADVVHIFSAAYASFLLAPLPAVLVARALGKPVLLNYHSGEAPDHLRRSSVARVVLRRLVDRIVVPSSFLREVFASFGLDARVVANTIDLARFEYRERVPLRPRLLSTRNFEPMYNVACTLRAFASIQARHPDATLTLVGAGSQEAALRALAADLRLRHVTFAGRVPPREIHRYYAQADIYVQTPSIDNMPLSLLEAFASGLPAVSTDVGGVPAILTHGTHGLLAGDNDDAGVAAQVLAILDRPEEACDALDWPVVRDQWLDIYRGVRRDTRGGAVVAAEAA